MKDLVDNNLISDELFQDKETTGLITDVYKYIKKLYKKMVNDDILIKFARKRGFSKTWPDQVNKMKSRMTEMKLGFPGIGNDHLSLMEYQNLKTW